MSCLGNNKPVKRRKNRFHFAPIALLHNAARGGELSSTVGWALSNALARVFAVGQMMKIFNFVSIKFARVAPVVCDSRYGGLGAELYELR